MYSTVACPKAGAGGLRLLLAEARGRSASIGEQSLDLTDWNMADLTDPLGDRTKTALPHAFGNYQPAPKEPARGSRHMGGLKRVLSRHRPWFVDGVGSLQQRTALIQGLRKLTCYIIAAHDTRITQPPAQANSGSQEIWLTRARHAVHAADLDQLAETASPA